MSVVVVVDDAEDMRRVVEDYLRIVGGWTVRSARSVAEARKLDWDDVDVAVIDWGMPEASGDVLIRWLAEHHPHVRRILWTAYDPAVLPDDIGATLVRKGAFDELIGALDG